MPPSQRVQQQNQKIQEIISNTSDKAAQIRKIAPVRQWFRPEENDANYQTIQSLAQGSIDVNEASTRLFANIDPKVSDDFNFWDLWYGILLTARQLPLRDEAEHTKLTSLLTAIKQHRHPNNDSHNHLYSNLTDFGPAVREAYNDTPEPDSAFEVEIESWASLNYFLALVTRDSIADFSIYAIWALREGLEVPYVDDEQGTAVQKYNTYVPAAVAWVLGMHRELYEKEEDLTPPEGEKRNPAKGGELWKGKAEFSKQRWASWKERLAAVAKDEKIAKRVQSLCADAVEDMERSETFQKGSS